MKKKVCLAVIGIIWVALLVIVCYLRFTHIDYTDLRFLVTYWKEEVLFLIMSLVFGIDIGGSRH